MLNTNTKQVFAADKTFEKHFPDWVNLRGSDIMHTSHVNCCHTSLSLAGKTRNMYRFSFQK